MTLSAQQEARLNLVLSATDNASKVIESFVQKIKRQFEELRKAVGRPVDTNQMVKPVEEAVSKINQEFEKINPLPAAKKVGEVSKITKALFVPLDQLQAKFEASKSKIENTSLEMVKSTDLTATQLRKILQEIGELPKNVEVYRNRTKEALDKINETVFLTREKAEETFNKLKTSIQNESLQEIEAAQLTDSVLKQILSAMVGHKVEIIKANQEIKNSFQREFEKINETLFITEEKAKELFDSVKKDFANESLQIAEFSQLTKSTIEQILSATLNQKVKIIKTNQEIRNSFETEFNKINETIYMTRDVAEQSFNQLKAAFKNESLQALEAGQLTNSALKRILSAEMQQKVEIVRANEEIGNSFTRLFHQLDQKFDLIGLQMAGQQLADFGRKGAEFFGSAVKSAAEFDQEIYNTISSMKALHPEIKNDHEIFQRLSQAALKFGSDGFFSANQVAQAMNTLARQGIEGEKTIIAASRTVAQVAAANQQDLEETANVVSDIFHEFGDQLLPQFKGNVDAAFRYIGDNMTSALHQARLSMSEYLDTLKYVGPLASQAGWDLRQTSMAIALLAEHGIRGSQAGTTLRRMLTNLIPETKKAKEEMQQLGFVTKDGTNIFVDASGKIKPFSEVLTILHDRLKKLPPAMQEIALKTIFGQYSLAGMAAIANTSKDKLAELSKHFGEAGITAKVLDEKSKGLGFSLQRLSAAFDTFKKSIGEQLAGPVEKVANWITQLVASFQKLDPHTKKLIVSIGAVASALALVAGTVLSAVAGIGFFTMGISAAGPVLAALAEPAAIAAAAIAGIIAIVTALKYVWDHNLGGIQQVTAKVWGFVQAQFNAAMTVLSHTVMAGITNVSKWWHKLAPDFNLAISSIIKILVALSPIWQALWNNMVNVVQFVWNTIGTILKGAWGIISGVFQLIIHLVSGDWKKLWGDVTQIISSALHVVTGLLHNLWQFMVNGFSNVLKMIDGLLGGWPSRIIKWFINMFNNIVNGFNSFGKNVENIWNGFKNWLSHTTQAIVQFVVKEFEWLYHHNYYFQHLVDAIVKAWNWLSRVSSQVWSAIKSFLLSVWNTLKSAATSVWNSVASFLSGVWNRIKSAVSSAWNSVASTFSSVWNRIKGYVHSGVTFIWNMLSNLASEAWSWGSNLMDMLASGIESGIGKVISAAENVAGQIARFLGFHSPTEDGPASDSDTWMPNFIKMLTKGIQEYRPLLQKEIFKIAMDLQYTLNPKIEHSQALQTAQEVSKKMTENMNNVMNLIEKARTVKELPDPFAEPESPNAYDRIAGHSAHHRSGTTTLYQFVPGHTSHHPRTTTMYDRFSRHQANHVVVNIHIEGRSKETDRQLVDMIQDQLVRKFRTYLPMHTTM